MGRNHKNRIVSEVSPIYEHKDWRQKKLRVAAYARVSTDSRDQANSLQNQKQHYDTLIPQTPNWEYVGLYADNGISGTSTRRRAEFNRMIEDCKAGKMDLIIVKDVPRFARNTVDCLSIAEDLLKLDPPVGIFFENNNLNTFEFGNKINLTSYAMFAEFESDLKSTSVKFGNRECFEQGRYFCPQNLLGYKKVGKYEMAKDPEGAKTVRLIYDLFLAGYPQKKIADTMMSLGLPTAKGSRKWSPKSISRILRNEKYSGDFLMQKTYSENFKTQKMIRNKGQKKIYYEPDHHDGIVTRDEQVRTLLSLKSNRLSPYFNNEYTVKVIRQGLLSGFIPMNPAFGGYSATHYLAALEAARVPQVQIEAEVAYVADAKRVRRELFCDQNSAALTLSPLRLAFNSNCIALMNGTAWVEVLMHPAERLLAVRKATHRNKNAIPWGAKTLQARELAGVVYALMGWQKDWKYKVTADCFARDGECVIFFDLGCCEFRFKDDGKITRAVPSDWLSEFGDNLPAHMMLCRRALANKLSDWRIDAATSSIEGFTLDAKPLTPREAEKRIEEMRRDHEG